MVIYPDRNGQGFPRRSPQGSSVQVTVNMCLFVLFVLDICWASCTSYIIFTLLKKDIIDLTEQLFKFPDEPKQTSQVRQKGTVLLVFETTSSKMFVIFIPKIINK